MAKDVSNQIENLEGRRTRKPAYIYDIWNSAYQYYLTSADEDLTYNGQTYEAAYIKCGGTEKDAVLGVSKLTVNASYLQEEVQRYILAAPLDITWLRVMKVYRNQRPREALVYFVGTIATVNLKGHEAIIGCEGLEKQLMQPVPRMRYQRLCPLSLYSTECGINDADYIVNATLSGISANGLTLTSATFDTYDDGYFDLGWLTFGGYKRMIASHEGSTITIRHQIPGLTGTDVVVAYPGCKKTMEACRDKFSNMNGTLDRFLGFPYMPYDNPTSWF